MTNLNLTIELFFGVCLFANAFLFIPQIINILKNKDSSNLSYVMFFGFNVIQFFTLLHGLINKDWLLVYGYGLTLITSGTVTFLIIYYRK